MPFNDIYRLAVYQRLHSAQVVNVMYFVQDDTNPLLGAQQLADDWVANMYTPMRNRCSSQLSFDYVEVRAVVPFTGELVTASFAGGSVGAQGLGVLSATNAEVITIYSSRGGRRGRGRIYLAGANSASAAGSNGGSWPTAQTTATTSLATAISTRYMAVWSGSTVGRWRLGVWSRVLAGPTPPWPTDAFVRATALTVRTTIRTQRRRQLGVGR